MANILHAHLWPQPFTTNLTVFPITPIQQTILYKACEANDINLLNHPDFIPLYNRIDNYLKENGPHFFKLSSISAKDSYYKDPTNAPLLQATTAHKLFSVFTTSMRITEELDDNDSFPIILTAWNDKIREDNEYRCFIFDGICEAIANREDESDPDLPTKELIEEYIKTHLSQFPDPTVALDVAVYDNQVIFIEFNPVDEELDTYGICRRMELSEKAYGYLAREPILKSSQ